MHNSNQRHVKVSRKLIEKRIEASQARKLPREGPHQNDPQCFFRSQQYQKQIERASQASKRRQSEQDSRGEIEVSGAARGRSYYR